MVGPIAEATCSGEQSVVGSDVFRWLRRRISPLHRYRWNTIYQGKDDDILRGASPLLHARRNPDVCPPFVIAAVKQRPEAVNESTALNAALPKSTLVVVDYPGSGQLAAHGLIAKELADFEKDLTKRLLTFVKDTPASAK